MMLITLDFEKKPLKKGTWSTEEDQRLIAYISRYGIWNWNEMPKAAGQKLYICIYIVNHTVNLLYIGVYVSKSSSLISFCWLRFVEVREELQASVDELPKARHKEGKLQQ